MYLYHPYIETQNRKPGSHLYLYAYLAFAFSRPSDELTTKPHDQAEQAADTWRAQAVLLDPQTDERVVTQLANQRGCRPTIFKLAEYAKLGTWP